MNPGRHQILEADFRMQLQDYGLRFDPVTGLANPAFFRGSIRTMLAEAAKRGEEIALLWIDVLNLRREYSIGGDEAAERLVRTVADSLRPWVEQGELICRFSDRCFVLALKREELLEGRLGLILEAAAQQGRTGADSRPEIAGGVAYYPEHASTAGDLIRFASLAAVSATKSRSRTPVCFSPELNTAVLHERELEHDLRLALRDNQLSLVYQPQLNLQNGEVTGVECLTRWHHPVRGHVSPAQFIPIAERSDLIHDLFAHSLRQLLADVAKWRAEGVVLESVAVNASAANVRHEDFVAVVQRGLAAHPPGNTQLDIEVTESLLMDDEALFVSRLKALRAIGVKVSLDDFGTRYTGFNALKGLPLNTMKIDKCFVHGIDRSSEAQALCRTIVMMAQQLRLSAIAEGVENPGELRALIKLGCQAGQGYLFQRPVPSDQFLQFMQEWPVRRDQGEFAGVFAEAESSELREDERVYEVA